jgi:uncharacterized protein
MGWLEELLEDCNGFDWGAGNSSKILDRHPVTPAECEEIFSNHPVVVSEDVAHSMHEARMYALGQTDAGRLTFVAFTIRGRLIRVISARDLSRKERKVYGSS